MSAVVEKSSRSVVIPIVVVCSKSLKECFACEPAGENFRSIDGRVTFGRDTPEAEMCRQAIRDNRVSGLMVDIP